jgi:hypothetical protein
MKLIYTHIPTDISRIWVKPDFLNLYLRESIKNAKLFYDKIEFYTNESFAETIKDIEGIDIIIHKTNIFDSELWALPKIHTYMLQEEPFIHIDCDVIIGHRPEFKETIVEKIEDGIEFKSIYKFNNGLVDCGYCMGVYGNKNMRLNQEYCEISLSYIEDNYSFFKKHGIGRHMSIYFEQMVLGIVLKKNNIIPETILNDNYEHLKYDKFKVETYNNFMDKYHYGVNKL